ALGGEREAFFDVSYRAFDLDGKVALITGGNSGIGLGMADAVAAAGAGVSIWGTDPDKNAAAATQLSAHGRRVQALVCDVADESGGMAARDERQPRQRVLHAPRGGAPHDRTSGRRVARGDVEPCRGLGSGPG